MQRYIYFFFKNNKSLETFGDLFRSTCQYEIGLLQIEGVWVFILYFLSSLHILPAKPLRLSENKSELTCISIESWSPFEFRELINTLK